MPRPAANTVESLGDNEDSRWSSAEAERILPAIAGLLRYRIANVRRLTIIALSRWQKESRPYLAEIRKLFKDPDPEVSSIAKHYARELA